MYPVFDPGAQLIGPTTDCLGRDTDGLGGGFGCAPEEVEGCTFVHETLNHAFRADASIVYGVAAKVTLMEYGERLAAAMKLADESREGLATAIGVSVQAIGQAVLGTTKAMTAENTLKAARHLAVNAYWLATGEESPRDAQAMRQFLSDEAVFHAVIFDRLTPEQRDQFKKLLAVVLQGRGHLGGMSNFGEFGS